MLKIWCPFRNREFLTIQFVMSCLQGFLTPCRVVKFKLKTVVGSGGYLLKRSMERGSGPDKKLSGSWVFAREVSQGCNEFDPF